MKNIYIGNEFLWYTIILLLFLSALLIQIYISIFPAKSHEIVPKIVEKIKEKSFEGLISTITGLTPLAGVVVFSGLIISYIFKFDKNKLPYEEPPLPPVSYRNLVDKDAMSISYNCVDKRNIFHVTSDKFIGITNPEVKILFEINVSPVHGERIDLIKINKEWGNAIFEIKNSDFLQGNKIIAFVAYYKTTQKNRELSNHNGATMLETFIMDPSLIRDIRRCK